MTERRSFYRKIAYVLAIAVLCLPIYVLSHPASLESDGTRSPGGKMAQLREEHHITQAQLGEIDPTSATMQLATLGLRGVAVQLLWKSVNHAKMTEDWATLAASLDQLIRMAPHFYSVWDFQAHNLAFNTSVEFDDYRDRFHWVMKGIEFFKNGVRFNDTDPRFMARIGQFYALKIGRADERVFYRQLFRKQQEEKGEKRTDNWLEAYDWYKRAQKLVDFPDANRPLRVYIEGQDASQTRPGHRAPSPVVFHSEPPMALTNYAENLEEDGNFGEAARDAWQSALQEWELYSGRTLPSSSGYIRLGDLEPYRERIEKISKELEELAPGALNKLAEEKLALLTPEERAIWSKDPAERSSDEAAKASELERKMKVTWQEASLTAPLDVRIKARQLASELAELEQMARTIEIYRDIVNYDYWMARCKSEITDNALEARELQYKADRAYRDGRLFDARELYEQAFAKWRLVLDEFPILRDNSTMASDLADEIQKYDKVLEKIPGAKRPTDFILQDMLDLNDGKRQAGTPPPAKPAADKKAEEKQKDTQPDKNATEESKPAEPKSGSSEGEKKSV